MTPIRRTRILLYASMFLALALLCGCRSASTGTGSSRDPVRSGSASTSEHEAIDRAYLRTLYQIDAEEQQAIQDGRLKGLGPAEMLAMTQSFESRRQEAKVQWEAARARHTTKRAVRLP
ncbi:MAG: hypothetical protein ACYTKC_04875 [Planctomycetota bacterium]|jgi:hypothetical protein